MNNKIKKGILVLSTLLITVLCLSGCMASESNVAFHWNGSIDYSVNYQISPQIFTSDESTDGDANERTQSYLTSIKEEIEGCTPATFEDTTNDEYAGLKFTASFQNVEAMTQSGIASVVSEQIPAPVVGEGEGVDIHIYVGNHGLYHTYQLLGEIPADILGLNSQMPDATDSGQSLYTITFSATAPLTFTTSSNAATVDGSTYIWESDSNSEAIPVEFTTNIPSLLGIILMAVVLLLIIALIVFLILKLTKKNPTDDPDESVTGAMENAETAFYGEESVSDKEVEEVATEEAADDLEVTEEAADDAEATVEEAVDEVSAEAEEIAEEAADAALDEVAEDTDSDTTA